MNGQFLHDDQAFDSMRFQRHEISKADGAARHQAEETLVDCVECLEAERLDPASALCHHDINLIGRKTRQQVWKWWTAGPLHPSSSQRRVAPAAHAPTHTQAR